MKILIITGGLGNQMFQYAYCHTLRKKGLKIKLDTSLYRYVCMHNGYELPHVFQINEPIITRIGIHVYLIRLLLKMKPSFIMKEEKLGEIMSPPSFFCKFIKGEFQSEAYFESCKDEIRGLFRFSNINEINKDTAKKINGGNSIALHIRRGDYVNNPVYSGICDEEYYLKAINYIRRVVPDGVFYVFSNDKEWSCSFMKKFFCDINYQIIDINNGEDSYMDMYLMSQCKHNIIVNSSFSWWGAWLNSNPQKIIIAPRKWANVDESHYHQIVPDNWIKI